MSAIPSNRVPDPSMTDRIELVAGEFWGRNPHDELTWLRANAPVWRDPRSGVWGVATYELVKHVSTHPELFSSAGGIRPDHGPSPMMIDMDDPQHLRRRKLVNKGFTPRRVREKEESIRGTVDMLIDRVCERGECDLVHDIAAWLPLIVIADALGVRAEDRVLLLGWSEDMMSMLGQKSDDAMERATAAGAAYFQYAARLIAERREAPTDDLMSILVNAEVDGARLDDHDIIFESLLILIGGDETTRHVISGGVYQLLVEPANWEALRADRSLLPVAIEEMLRWVSPIKNMARTATVDTRARRAAHRCGGASCCCCTRRPTATRPCSTTRSASTSRRTPNDHVAFGFGPTSVSAPVSPGSNSPWCSTASSTVSPISTFVDQAEPAHRAANFVSGYERHAGPLHPVPVPTDSKAAP